MASNEKQLAKTASDERSARATVRLVVMDVLMSQTDVHPEKVATATRAIMAAMQAGSTKWAFRVHAGGSRT